MQLTGKTILVTGAGGFIGSHLVERLVTLGAKVKAFVRYNSKNQWGWLEYSPYKNDFEVCLGDIRDYDSVSDAVQGVQTVFHLAALIGIPYSYVSPLAYLKTNVEGTYNVLQAARQAGVEKLIQTSTSEVYGTAQYVPMNEIHPLQPQSPYSASKIGADNLALSYFHAFDLPVTVARPFNTYGPRQSGRAIIPTIITQILSGQKSIVLGNLTPTRDLNFVRDTVDGFMAIAASEGLSGETVNIGTGREVSMGELAKMIGSLMDVDLEVRPAAERIRPKNSEVERLLADNRKIKENTGWAPQYTLEDGLQATIEWLQENLPLYKPEIYNV